MADESQPRSLRATIAAAVVVAVGILLVSAAAAAAALPEKTAAPTISPTSPVVSGITETATTGTWSGSPTGYAYSWYRCTGETCKSIPEATSASYVPTAADVGKSLRVLVTASNAEGSGSAISAATSVARAPFTYYWNVCKKTEGGTCLGEWTKLAEGSPVSFTAASTTSVTFTPNIFAPVTISCSGQSATGSLENPSGKAAGKGSTSSFKLTGCSVVSPAGCKVPSTISFNAMSMTAVEFAYGPAVKFQPSAGESFFTMTITECALSGSYTFKGSFIGIDNPKTSSLEFTKASTAGLRGGTNPAPLEFTTRILTAAGEALKLEQ